MKRRGFTYTELLCVMSIVLAVWMLLLPLLARSRNRADEAACSQHLRNISWALTLYAQDHYGHLPPTVTALTPRYLHDYDIYRCPKVVAAEKRWPKEYPAPPEGTSDYAYAPGLANDDHPRDAVAWDREPWHRHGGNVLYLSGAVAHVEAAELDRLNRTLGAASPEAK
jgi:type II secretory pathway pseudopilin PulG